MCRRCVRSVAALSTAGLIKLHKSSLTKNQRFLEFLGQNFVPVVLHRLFKYFSGTKVMFSTTFDVYPIFGEDPI